MLLCPAACVHMHSRVWRHVKAGRSLAVPTDSLARPLSNTGRGGADGAAAARGAHAGGPGPTMRRRSGLAAAAAVPRRQPRGRAGGWGVPQSPWSPLLCRVASCSSATGATGCIRLGRLRRTGLSRVAVSLRASRLPWSRPRPSHAPNIRRLGTSPPRPVQHAHGRFVAGRRAGPRTRRGSRPPRSRHSCAPLTLWRPALTPTGRSASRTSRCT
jgi:hypothetical protein